jgi:hypothetical protein
MSVAVQPRALPRRGSNLKVLSFSPESTTLIAQRAVLHPTIHATPVINPVVRLNTHSLHTLQKVPGIIP